MSGGRSGVAEPQDHEPNRVALQSAKAQRRRTGRVGECDSQTQWSERFLLETMRTFPAALEMGIAQHTTRGEDRPLLSPPIAGLESRVSGGSWL